MVAPVLDARLPRLHTAEEPLRNGLPEVPEEVPEMKNKIPCNGSVTTTPNTVPGPLLVMLTMYSTLLPITVLVAPDIVTPKSAICAVAVVTIVAELFDRLGSLPVLVMVAVLVMEPGAVVATTT